MMDIDSENYQKKDDKFARGERLALLRKRANVSRSQLSQEYGLSIDTLKNWELGRFTGLTEKGARRILTIFKDMDIQLSLAWLLYGTGSPPVILNEDMQQNQDSLHDEDDNNTSDAALPKEIEVFCNQHADAIYTKVDDAGMEPYFFKGDYVAGKRYYQEDIREKAIGQHCIVETQRGEILLRLVREGTKEGYYSLLCVNVSAVDPTQFLYEAELVSAAPVNVHVRPIE